MLEGLPEDLLVNILSRLDDDDNKHINNGANNNPLESALRAIPCVCRSWREAVSTERTRFWNLLSNACGNSSPTHLNGKIGGVGGGTSSSTRPTRRRRSSNNPKISFFKRRREIRDANRQEKDRIVGRLVTRLKKNDCVAYLRKQLQAQASPLSVLVHHRAAELEHRTLLHYACWYGRIKTVQFLLEEYYGDEGKGCSRDDDKIWQVDDSNATPLLLAAWAGQANVVKILLRIWKATTTPTTPTPTNTHNTNTNPNPNNNHKVTTTASRDNPLDIRGVPPLTSSCGGKGPKTAVTWAQRKGYHNVVKLLQQQQQQHQPQQPECKTGPQN